MRLLRAFLATLYSRQYDLDESASSARVSRLRDANGNGYSLIQIEGYAARTVDDSEECINQAVLALIEASGCRWGASLSAFGRYDSMQTKVAWERYTDELDSNSSDTEV